MKLRWSHLPSWLVIIGYPVFWLELLFHPGPRTSLAAPLLFLLIVLAHLRLPVPSLRDLQARWGRLSYFEKTCLVLSTTILAFSLAASLLPPHLGQEGDALNYHLSLPRQHLIQGSFAHIPWSAADLWLMPLQWALSPYWFCTPLPNKFPQFIFLLGLLGVGVSLARRVTPGNHSSWIAIAAILGSHGLAIQFGTAMLDLAIAYLGLAAIDSFCEGDLFLAAIEAAFFVWSKSFIPLQMLLVLLGLMGAETLRRVLGLRWTFSFAPASGSFAGGKKFVVSFVLASLLIGGPFLIKSFYYAGTPLFPFGTFLWGGQLAGNPISRSALLAAGEAARQWRETYGNGRGIIPFLLHFWRIAVPSQGVNNIYDYPLGLPYLLSLGPFVLFFLRSLKRGELPVLPLLGVLLYGTWWVGSQQSRWLYLPVILFFITALTDISLKENRFLKWGLAWSLVLVTISLCRANLPDIKGFPHSVLRDQDRRLLLRSRNWNSTIPMPVNNKEVAYAETSVVVKTPESGWILPVPNPS